MTKFRNLSLFLMVFALLGLTSCDKDNEETGESSVLGQETITNIINANGTLLSLRTALKTASGDLPETFNGSGPFTVFAPDNSAFDALATQSKFESLEELMANVDPALLEKILTYHVVANESGANDLSEGTSLATVQGDNLIVTVSEDGTIQLLDATKLPQTNPVSNVTNSNTDAANGIVHFIDKVLLPQEAIDALGIDIRPSILDWGKATKDLSLLVKALDKVGLVDTVKELDSATVLAPTDQAIQALFEALGNDYNSLEDFDNEAEITLLRDIMTYHVLPASADLMAGEIESAFDGNSVKVVAENGGFTFGDATGTNATTVTADIQAKNGVVQIIDKVLLPQAALDFLDKLASDDLATLVIETPQLSILEEALVATELAAQFMDKTNAAPDSTATNFTYNMPATVFAPTDAAFNDLFAALGEGYTGIDSFDSDEELALLTDILLYHVLSGETTTAALSAGPLTTAVGTDIEIIEIFAPNGLVIGDATDNINAQFEKADSQARNGVLHVIDKVLVSQRAIDFVKSQNEGEEDN